jgi:hypothetical protein
VAGANNTSIGKISNLPASISKIYTSLEKSLKNENEPAGPTSESPGPILFNVAKTDVKLVVISYPSREIKSNEKI